MIKIPYKKGAKVDEGIKHVLVPSIKKVTLEQDDNFLLALTGVTGSGKSTLGFHVLDLYVDEPSIEYVALSRDRFARALKKASDGKLPRYVNYDEADVIKRDAMSKWNKAIIKLYAKIRGKNMFHIWAHPSPEMLDKHQVQEVVNGLVYIYKKSTPRMYYYFTKDGLLGVLNDFGNLKEASLKKGASKHASWRGWFEKYEGPLWEEYLELKRGAMEDAIDEFFSDWGEGKVYNLREASDHFGVSLKTVQRRVNDPMNAGLFSDARNAAGMWKLREKHLELLRDLIGGESRES